MNKIFTHTKKKLQNKLPNRFKKPEESQVAGTRVTNETVAEAREDVLKSARKIIYPLTHSKHKVLTVSTFLIIMSLLGFFVAMILVLYRFKDTSDFTYQVTKVVPFPIARVGGTFVPYENYLFEIKRYIFYYNNVENIDFTNPVYKPQLDDQKTKVLQRVVDMAYIKKIAQEKEITVSDEEIDQRISVLKNQNRLGNNDSVFEDTLRDFYNWSVSDFRRSIRNDILTSKVLASVDVDARTEANTVIDELKKGVDFATLAAKYSDDDATKNTGGEIAGLINPKDRNTSSELSDALSKIQVGQTSEIINVGYGFEIVKKLEDKDGQYRAAHIFIAFKSTDEALNDRKSKEKATVYIKL